VKQNYYKKCHIPTKWGNDHTCAGGEWKHWDMYTCQSKTSCIWLCL